jgi:predicted GNAT family N-acyltransferase
MLEVHRLNADDAREHDFDCGDADLNEFFFEDSRLASQELISVTYAWKQNGKTLGYFSLSNDSVKRELFSKPQIKNVARPKRYATLPAVKIGRLAVAHNAKKQGIGSNILSLIIKQDVVLLSLTLIIMKKQFFFTKKITLHFY